MDFKLWLENLQAKREGIRDTILSFLKDKLGITDDSQILSMPLKVIKKEILRDLLERGVITIPDDNIAFMIRNGNVTVSELVDKLAGSDPISV